MHSPPRAARALTRSLDLHACSFLWQAPAPSRSMDPKDFFTDYGEATRYTIKEVIGKGSYGVVCSAVDNYTGEKVRAAAGWRGSAFVVLAARACMGAAHLHGC